MSSASDLPVPTILFGRDTFRDAEQRGWEEYEEKRRMADWMARKDHKRRRMSETGCPKRQRKSSLITDVTMDTD
uniref:Uncharacterized protein n=1 Tax=Perkinsus chesapeaki TaxID=330153 RepID=C9VXK3_PERCH|nr:unknown protein [Perkinsus chesapeaki]